MRSGNFKGLYRHQKIVTFRSKVFFFSLLYFGGARRKVVLRLDCEVWTSGRFLFEHCSVDFIFFFYYYLSVVGLTREPLLQERAGP
ncbi:hypothetical protein QBC42DRAFT_270294 [Cladorrhinum samala]|uniref:Uncharacterized protein n=1 Tax=Cladorrhinum samala TaxID=585594 RepID=A0AAV9HKI7_9PEZI|nr:hypothetical protein QBC42DRAFT_270294 [Cladorrhinum samala]